MKGLIIPGGESTVMGHLLKKNAFLQKIKNWLDDGEDQKFVWGTCAGLILLANQLENAKEGGQCLLGELTIYYVSIILDFFAHPPKEVEIIHKLFLVIAYVLSSQFKLIQ